MSSHRSTELLERRPERRTFYGLDALRGIAATVVVSRHAPAFFGEGLFPGSSLGVDLFFVLSGFVIAHAYDGRFQRGLTALQFIRIRLIRLMPLYLLGTLIGVIVAVATLVSGVTSAQTGMTWHAGALVKSALLSVVLLPTPPVSANLDSLYPLNAVAWSLAFEILINVIYAVVQKRLTNSVLIIVMVVSGALLCASALARQNVDLGWNWPTALVGLTRVFYSFPAGLLLYRLSESSFEKQRFSIVWSLTVALFVFKVEFPGSAEIWFSLLAILVLFPAITLAASRARIPDRAVKPCAFLGLTSYALYALHRPLLSVINGVLQIRHLHVAPFAPAVGGPLLALLLATAWVVDLSYDQPVRRWLTRVVEPRRMRGAPSAVHKDTLVQ